MKFRHKVELIQFNGQRSAASRIYVLDVLWIGRSNSCQIQLKDPQVAVKHARLLEEGGKLIIEVERDAAPIQVNRHRRKKATLKAGDRLRIGETEFLVFFDKSYWGFEEVRDERKVLEPKDLVAKRLKELDLNQFFPNHLILSLLVFTLVLLVGVIEPVTGSAFSWLSGPVANPHRMFQDNCESCHTRLFARVEDSACKACHKMTDHIKTAELKVVKLHATPESCLDCHREHNGAEITRSSDFNCVACHGRREFNIGHLEGRGVRSFDRHPEFRVVTGSGKPAKRIPLNQSPKFDSTVRFNHEKHLQGEIHSRDGLVSLSCSSCHELEQSKRGFSQIKFQRHCQSCHTLGFDPELADREVPHGDSDVVYQYLYGEYAKHLLSSQSPPDRSGRIRPGAVAEEERNRAFVQEAVENRAREAEELLFARTGCQLCHTVSERESYSGKILSRYQVIPANIPTRWMPASIFNHSVHTAAQCQECHAGARRSSSAEDIIMPSIKTCYKCHGDSTDLAHDKVGSPCVSCHSFHEPLAIDESRKLLVDAIRGR
jgi:hypothetical protein